MSNKWKNRDRKRQAKRKLIPKHGHMLKNAALDGVAAEAVEPVRGKRRKRQR